MINEIKQEFKDLYNSKYKKRTNLKKELIYSIIKSFVQISIIYILLKYGLNGIKIGINLLCNEVINNKVFAFKIVEIIFPLILIIKLSINWGIYIINSNYKGIKNSTNKKISIKNNKKDKEEKKLTTIVKTFNIFSKIILILLCFSFIFQIIGICGDIYDITKAKNNNNLNEYVMNLVNDNEEESQGNTLFRINDLLNNEEINKIKEGEISTEKVITYLWINNITHTIILLLNIFVFSKITSIFNKKRIVNPFSRDMLNDVNKIQTYILISWGLSIIVNFICYITTSMNFKPQSIIFDFNLGIITIFLFIKILIQRGNKLIGDK